MRPRIAVALALALVVAGCLSGATPGGPDGSTATTTPPLDTTTSTPPANDSTTTTPAEPPPTNLTRKALPERPDDLTAETVVEYVAQFEQAYTYNRQLTNRTTELTVNPVRSSVRNATGGGYVVHLEVGLSWTLLRDGDEVAGHGVYTVNHLVNGTALARAETGGQVRPGPDPRNGTVVWTADGTGGS